MVKKTGPQYKGKHALGARHHEAARLIASNTLTFPRIAEQIGTTTHTLANWRSRPDFEELVRHYAAEIVQKTSTLKYSDRNRRVTALNEMAEAYETIIRERAEWFAINEPEIPGARTGHLVKQEKVLGVGKGARYAVEYVLDAKLDSEFKDTLMHIAKERGEWSEKREVTGAGGVPLLPITEIIVNLPSGFDTDDDEDGDD